MPALQGHMLVNEIACSLEMPSLFFCVARPV